MTLPSVLVVIADPQMRELVGWIVEGMDLTVTLTASWRQAIVETVQRPSCIVADLDDVGGKSAGIAVLRKGWGNSVPLVVLSGKSDVEERASSVGAVVGLRIPINIGLLMDVIRRTVTNPGPG